MKKTPEEIEVLGNYAGLLSLIEVGLGSILHTFHLPFAGHFLSLNQGYLLCRISIKTKDRVAPYFVSNIAALLKSLSPSGNKLGPMLSLSVQGLLFSFGLIFGVNPLGLSVGMILLSVWAFFQPLVTYYLFFGEKLFNALGFLYEKTGLPIESALWMLLGIIVLKAFLGVVLAIAAWRFQGDDQFQGSLIRFSKEKKTASGSPLVLAFKDLMKPLFVVSLFITGFFLYYSQENLWYLLRPIAVGFIFFYFSRTLTLDRFLTRLHGGRFEVFAKGCEIALRQIRRVI